MHEITISKSPTNGGTIFPSNDTLVSHNQKFWLLVNADDKYKFSHWTGNIDSTTENPLSLTVNKNLKLKANFEVKNYNLTVNKNGKGAINERIIDSKSKKYEHGTLVELTAHPAEGYKFIEWTGDIRSTLNPTKITVDSPKEITAIFKKKAYALSIHSSGKGATKEKVIKQKTTDHKYGTIVEITANPASGWKFVKWQGDLQSSENPTTLTIDTTKTVTAIFKKKQYNVTINISGKGNVNQKVIQQKSTNYKFGKTVELTVDPADGWRFKEWLGAVSGTQDSVQITIDEPKNITAVFKKVSYRAPLIELNNVTNITEGPFSQGMEYVNGELLMFTASADDHSTFDGLVQRIDISDWSLIGKQKHNLGHVNNTSYDDSSDILMMGNLPGYPGHQAEIYIIYNFSSLLGGGTIDFNSVSKKVIDLSDFPNKKWNMSAIVASFGEYNNGKRNIIYINNGFSRKWAKLKLGMGSNNLGNGIFEKGVPPEKYNGSYKVIWTKNYAIKEQNNFGVTQGTDWYRNLLFTADGHNGLFVSIWSNIKNDKPLKREVIRTQIFDDTGIASDTVYSEGITQIKGDFYMGVIVGSKRYIGKFDL